MNDSICQDQLKQIGQQKEPIKRRVRFALEQKDRSRQIESKDKRIVHFLFDSGVPNKESTFARAYKRF